MATITSLNPYIFFGGECRAAIEHYKERLGAVEEMSMTFAEAPGGLHEGVPEEWGGHVMHASIRIGGHLLQLSDGMGENDKPKGFRLSLGFSTMEDARAAFDSIAQDGEVDMPFAETFWSPGFGMATDKFGVGWMFSVDA